MSGSQAVTSAVEKIKQGKGRERDGAGGATLQTVVWKDLREEEAFGQRSRGSWGVGGAMGVDTKGTVSAMALKWECLGVFYEQQTSYPAWGTRTQETGV